MATRLDTKCMGEDEASKRNETWSFFYCKTCRYTGLLFNVHYVYDYEMVTFFTLLTCAAKLKCYMDAVKLVVTVVMFLACMCIYVCMYISTCISWSVNEPIHENPAYFLHYNFLSLWKLSGDWDSSIAYMDGLHSTLMMTMIMMRNSDNDDSAPFLSRSHFSIKPLFAAYTLCA